MAKDKRSNKWAFLIYQESAPKNYLDILEEMHIPFVLSPWHDKDINKETGEFKKAHKHGNVIKLRNSNTILYLGFFFM